MKLWSWLVGIFVFFTAAKFRSHHHREEHRESIEELVAKFILEAKADGRFQLWSQTPQVRAYRENAFSLVENLIDLETQRFYAEGTSEHAKIDHDISTLEMAWLMIQAADEQHLWD